MSEKKLADRLHNTIRLRGYSIRTEKAYVQWHERFVRFHNLRHPSTMGAAEVEQFLSHLASQEQVAASTQNPCTELVEVRLSLPSCSSTATSSAFLSTTSTSCAPSEPPTSSPTSTMTNACASSPNL
ncbi:MAG: site-specific integrase, partial [Anaerolineales bacterium]|nr:site-specific integrase [Anaerolineales bacterium]